MEVGEVDGEESAAVAAVVEGRAWAAAEWVVGALEVAGWEAEGVEEQVGACSNTFPQMLSSCGKCGSALHAARCPGPRLLVCQQFEPAHPGKGGCGGLGEGGLGGTGGGAHACGWPQPTRANRAAFGRAVELVQRAVSTDKITLPEGQLTAC